MSARLPDACLDQVFRTARTRNGWTPETVSEALLREVYEMAALGPTASNAQPARFLFLTSDAAKQRLAPHMSSGNRAKTLAAPVNVIMAYDLNFADQIPKLFPHNPTAGNWFKTDAGLARQTAFRNGSLQAAYLMLAARSLGLDCGPMSGFKTESLNAEFFAGTTWEANFVCSIGYGTDENLFPRGPRLAFEDACRIL